MLSMSPSRSPEANDRIVHHFSETRRSHEKRKLRRAPTLEGCASPFGDPTTPLVRLPIRKVSGSELAGTIHGGEEMLLRSSPGEASVRSSHSVPSIHRHYSPRTPMKMPLPPLSPPPQGKRGSRPLRVRRSSSSGATTGTVASAPSECERTFERTFSPPALQSPPPLPSCSSIKNGYRPNSVASATTACPTSVASTRPTSVASALSAASSVANSALPGSITPAAVGGCFGWRRGEEIGAGRYGSVYKAQNRRTGEIFAVKVAKVDERDTDEKHFCENLRKELAVCHDLRHKHIVNCLGHEYVDQCLYIYLEYCAGGSVRKMLNEFGPFEGQLLKRSTRGLLKGLNYLHTHDPPVVHRDLKCANILVDLNFCVKLADFGCSRRDVKTESFSTVGSVCWMAPEVIESSGHGRAADIWSLGCVIIEMATAADPWGKGAFDNMIHAMNVIRSPGRTPPIPENLPDAGRDLIGQCIQRDPEQRPQACELVRHDFVAHHVKRVVSLDSGL
eukprot:gnl/TRDRNA2_/TRDRNA2_47403_c0_seq2.p1 gnl/TRDRNA2_/TRDRNA2_47403_c0~~gnl/TRDRNA2_/TRDRNA2_47403_c0_seq2.p1  ORF type:complete len:504 (-),score=55.88 gnl/TRDRNA2_/TRDRNA2_47403_c0_seq2:334-1845(-)